MKIWQQKSDGKNEAIEPKVSNLDIEAKHRQKEHTSSENCKRILSESLIDFTFVDEQLSIQLRERKAIQNSS